MRKCNSILLFVSASLAFNISVQASTNIFSQNLESSFAPIELYLQGDFTKALSLKRATMFEEEESVSAAGDENIFVEGILKYKKQSSRSYNVKLKARGNSVLSPEEADFPKLKVEIDDSIKVKDTLFEDARSFRINTHLMTHPRIERTTQGRLVGNNGPWREGLAYGVAKVLGLVAPATSLATIDYVNTANNGDESFTRNALLIETDKKMMKRIGATETPYMDVLNGSSPVVNSEYAALFFLFHKLIGNEDIQVRVHEPVYMETARNRVMWNTFVVGLPDGIKVPVVYDLDLATFVTGPRLIQARSNSEFGFNDIVLSNYLTKLAEVRQKIPHEDLVAAVEKMKSLQNEIIDLVKKSPIDSDGKLNALNHIKMFFDNIDIILDVPVIADENVYFYKHAVGNELKTKSGLSGEDLTLRPGTPFKPIAIEGNRAKIAILDIHGDLLSGESYQGYIEMNSAIARRVPQKYIGRVDDRDR